MRCFSIAFASASLLLFASSLQAQAPPDPNFDYALKPFGSFNNGNIDRVNVMNGQLSLTIPLVMFPQRGGKLSLGFDLSYHNSGAWSNFIQNEPDVPAGYVTGTFGFDHGFTITESNGAPATPPVTMRNADPIGDPNNPTETYSTIVLKTTSADGTDHYMVKNNSDSTFTQPSTWYSGDLSGYRTYIGSQIGYSDSYWGETDATVYGPDGTFYTGYSSGIGTIPGTFGFNLGPSVPTLRQDSNGNQITYSSSSGYTDTMGRIIPQFTSISPSGSGCAPGTTSASQWVLPGANNGSYPITFCFSYNPMTEAAQSYSESGSLEPVAGNSGGLKQIILPNGTSWQFEYSSDGSNPDAYNDLTKVAFPTGGSVSYTWGSHLMCPNTQQYSLPRTLVSRTANPNTPGQASSTTTYAYSGTECGPYTATVTDGAGNDTIHYFDAGQVIYGSSPYESKTEYYNGNGGGRTLLRSMQNSYASQGVTDGLSPSSQTIQMLTGTTTTDVSGLQSSVTYQYDNNLVAYPSTTLTYYPYSNPPAYSASSISFGKQIATSKYDFGQGSPGSLLRTTGTSYSAFSDPNHAADYMAANMLNLTYQTRISGPAGETSLTAYKYDESATQSSGVTISFAPSATSVRGNVTSISQSPDGSATQSTSICSGTNITSKNTYYDTGMLYQSVDPCGHATTMSYSGSPNLTYTTTSTKPTLTGGPVLKTSATYDWQTGQMISTLDYNSQQTNYGIDRTGRLTGISYPDLGSVSFNYSDANGGCASDFFQCVTIRQIQSANVYINTEVDVDGFGRKAQTALTAGAGKVYSQTFYDALGRVYENSNPSYCANFAGCTETTAGLTSNQYDALGRVTTVTYPDGALERYTYSGNVVSYQDPSLRTWNRISDALGRLTDVYEDPAGANIHTNYQYDGFGNLKSATQFDSSGNTRQRTFAYDALSRLLIAGNPETGNVGYSYTNPDGSLCAGDSSLPCSKTDARGMTLTYQYDSLDRMTSETGTGIDNVYNYDDASHSYGMRRLTHSSAASDVATDYYYDPMGRLVNRPVCVPADCTYIRGASGTYDLAGHLTDSHISSGADITTTYDSAGRISGASYVPGPNSTSTALLKNVVNGPSGMNSAVLGNGLLEQWGYDNRLRSITYNVGAPATTSTGGSSPSMWLDSAQNTVAGGQNIPVDGSVTAVGWAADNEDGAPVPQVMLLLDGVRVASAELGLDRLDVANANSNPNWRYSGFTVTAPVSSLSVGNHTVTVEAYDSNGNVSYSYPIQITVTSDTAPHNSFDGVTGVVSGNQNVPQGGMIHATGWAADDQDGAPVAKVEMLMDGQPFGKVTNMGLSRPDVASAWGRSDFTNSGWDFTGTIHDVSVGTHMVTVATYDKSGNESVAAPAIQINVTQASNTLIGNMDPTPTGSWSETAFAPGATVSAAGWAADTASVASLASPPATTVQRVEIEIDGQTFGTATLGGSRPDVASAKGANYINSGWSFSQSLAALPAGAHFMRARAYMASGASFLLDEDFNFYITGNTAGSSSLGQPARYSYALDYLPNSSIKSSSDTVSGSWTYDYDSLNRLTGAVTNGGGAIWAYDSFGNRIAQLSLGGNVPESTTLPDQFNRVSTWCYDDSGNVVDEVPCSQITLHQYSYDAKGRLATSAYGTTTYIYDADGNRVAKESFGTVKELYFYDVLGRVTVDQDSAAIRQEIYVGNRHLASIPDGASPIYNHTNWLGTEVARSDSNGNLCQTLSALPFGDGLQFTGTCNPTTQFFTGKERDPESGLDYFGARYYGSNMGRMMSPDPIGGNLLNPQSLNKYSYALNNPLINTDPTGLYVCQDSTDCSSKQDKSFEKALNSLRGSKNADVARAAGAYGAANKDNGVTVGFAQTTGKGEDGVTSSSLGTNDNGKTFFAKSDVTINTDAKGAAFDAAIGHEGSHVADAQDTVNSLTVNGGDYTVGMPITRYQSEQRAYGVTNAILSSEGVRGSFGCDGCVLGQGTMQGQVPGIVNQLMNTGNNYMSGGQHMGPNNQGGSVVNGLDITPKAAVPQVPH